MKRRDIDPPYPIESRPLNLSYEKKAQQRGARASQKASQKPLHDGKTPAELRDRFRIEL